MKRSISLFLLLWLGCLGPVITLATDNESICPWGIESSIPRWAEAGAKSSLLRKPIPMADSVHSYDVLFYQLNLYFPIMTDSLMGTALIRCQSDQTYLDSIYLHLNMLTVDSVLVDGSIPYSWNHTGGKLIIHFTTSFSYNDTFEVLVAYRGIPYSGYYTTGSGELRTGYTVTEPSDSRYWFPCWDESWDKADEGSKINAEVPLGFVVASNGLLTGIDTTYYPSDTTVTYHWAESYPIATYLMSVAIAKYKQILDYYVTGTGDSVEVRHFVYGEDSSRAQINFRETLNMMEFFSSIFGEYPFEKYGMACITGFWGGMEHQTMTTILRSAATDGWEDGIAHELAHQWWGDMVTCFDWPEIWLNEGFATYSEAMWHEHKYGFESFKDKITDYGNDYLYGSYTTYPLYDPPSLFSWSLVYTKGAWVLHMLRHIVGDTSYSNILKAYGEKFKYGNATTQDFREVVDSVMNDTFNYYFQQWVYQPEHPQYEYGWQIQELGGENYRFDTQVRQIQQYGPLFRMPVDLMLSYNGGDTTFSVWIEADTFQEIEIPLTLPAGSSNFTLTFDPDNWLLDEHQEVPYTTVNIVSTSPVQNELNVPTSTNISVIFDVAMDETTINDSTFIVNGRSTGPSQGMVSYNSLTKTATFYPSDDFDSGELVTVVLSGRIRSSGGILLKKGYIYSFTTVVDDGSGTFVTDSVYPVGDFPASVFAADFDGDGDLDIATANAYSKNVSILLNDGGGTFAPNSVYQVGDSARSIYGADLDSDGDLDLTTANFGSGDVSVLLNNGDVSFSSDSVYQVGGCPTSVFATDLDGDGDIDIATAGGGNNVWVLLNNGDGTFISDSAYSVGLWPRSIFAADLDGDGDLDLTTANEGSNDVSVLLNNGDAIFSPNSVYAVVDTPVSVFVADLDGDSDLDLTTANTMSMNVSVLLNNGDGTFATHSTYSVDHAPISVLASDFDSDGDLDIATANPIGGNVSVLWNNGNATFTLPSAYEAGEFPYSVFAADLDGDGDLDLATANANSDNVSVLLNQPAYACGDCNGDGRITGADATYIITYIYRGGPAPIGQGDVNLDSRITGADATYIITYIYRGGHEPCQPSLTDIRIIDKQ